MTLSLLVIVSAMLCFSWFLHAKSHNHTFPTKQHQLLSASSCKLILSKLVKALPPQLHQQVGIAYTTSTGGQVFAENPVIKGGKYLPFLDFLQAISGHHHTGYTSTFIFCIYLSLTSLHHGHKIITGWAFGRVRKNMLSLMICNVILNTG